MSKITRQIRSLKAGISKRRIDLSGEVKILLGRVGEADREIVASCNRLLESLILEQAEATAELIYRLKESLQNGEDESFPTTEEVFRAWWHRHIQWPTHRHRPDSYSLGSNSWLQRVSCTLAENALQDPSIKLADVIKSKEMEIGDNHEMEFVDQTEVAYKAEQEIKHQLNNKGWTIRIPKETINIGITREAHELRKSFVARATDAMDQELQKLLSEMAEIIGDIKSEVVIPHSVDNPESFLVRRMFGEKVNTIALDVGPDDQHRVQVDEITRSVALRFGLLHRKYFLDDIKERVRRFLANNPNSS